MDRERYPYFTTEEMLRIPAEEISDIRQFAEAPLVSVVVMTRNHQEYIVQAVESIVVQEADFLIEILIGEDCSFDNTRSECERLRSKYPQLIRLIVADKNVGITNNFLRLVSRARGRYIALLEGDDYWTHSRKLQLQADLMESHPDYSCCGARTNGRTFWAKKKKYYTLKDILKRYIFHTSSLFFRKEILDIYPNFPDIIVWDSMLQVYLLEYGKCGYLDEEVSFYRRHHGGMYTSKNAMQRIELAHMFTDIMDDYFKGEYKRELCDKELWICKMETSIVLSAKFWRRWSRSLNVVIIEAPRIGRVLFWRFLFFSLSLIVQPFSAAYFLFRRNLAIRRRLGLDDKNRQCHK